MDPRPNDFSYRRPRPNNLTYASYGASQSLFHVGSYSKQFPITETYRNSLRKQERFQKGDRWNINSISAYNPESVTVNPLYIRRKNNDTNNKTGQPQIKNQLSRSLIFDSKNCLTEDGILRQKNQKDSLTAWISFVESKKYSQGQDKVYQLQQKPYNIINHHPKQTPDIHRQYPRFTLENQQLTQSMPITKLS